MRKAKYMHGAIDVTASLSKKKMKNPSNACLEQEEGREDRGAGSGPGHPMCAHVVVRGTGPTAHHHFSLSPLLDSTRLVNLF